MMRPKPWRPFSCSCPPGPRLSLPLYPLGENRTAAMSDDSWTWCTERAIPSETNAGKSFLDELLVNLEAHQWVQHDIFGIHLAMEEALVNAIKHGNRHDVNKRVHICCKLSTQRLWIRIADEGPGFNPENVADCTDLDNL